MSHCEKIVIRSLLSIFNPPYYPMDDTANQPLFVIFPSRQSIHMYSDAKRCNLSAPCPLWLYLLIINQIRVSRQNP